MTHRSRPFRPRVLAASAVLAAAAAAGCGEAPPQALGTLEYDRVTLPAPAAERIVAIEVREGEQVAEGAKLLTLERTVARAQAQALESEALRQHALLSELRTGPRAETIARARADLHAAQAQARDASAYADRLQPLGRQQLVAAADVDRARAAAANAQAQVRSARAVLDELEHGTRPEQLAQGEAAVRAAQAQVDAQRATLRKLDLVAPRAGRVDSLPYRLGDQAPVGAPLVVLLVGDTPYARVYVPEPLRAGVAVGQRARVSVDGRDAALEGRVRMVRSDPTFTPYYALTGSDAARLSYLAEIALDDAPEARGLPAGLPVRVDFVADGARARE